MMRRYKVDDSYYWYEEGTQPANATLVESKRVEPKMTKVESEDTEENKVAVKVKIPKNKSKGVKAK